MSSVEIPLSVTITIDTSNNSSNNTVIIIIIIAITNGNKLKMRLQWNELVSLCCAVYAIMGLPQAIPFFLMSTNGPPPYLQALPLSQTKPIHWSQDST